MRVGIFGDIHGNAHALAAVLEVIGTVDEYWVLGDLAAIGGEPERAVSIVRELANTKLVRGNTDRYLLSFDRPPPPTDAEQASDMERGFQWSTDAVKGAGHLEWLSELPLDRRGELPDGTRVLLVHASPGKDDGVGFKLNEPDDATAARMLEGCDADLVVVGHTHKVVDRVINGVRVINAGPASNPPPGDDARAAYAILEADATGHRIDFGRVEYDLDDALDAVDRSGFPSARFVRSLFGR
jgi:predicted phosphodiesterase